MSSIFDAALLKKLQIELRKKSKLEWLGIVLLGAVVLFMGTLPAFAADFTWDGDGGDALWSNTANWTVTGGGSGVPDDSGDNATLADVSPGPNCTFDLGSATTINNLTITGSSPTRMKLNVSSNALTIDNELALNDYSELDVDQNLTVGTGLLTRVLGSILVDIAANKTFAASDMVVGDTDTILDFTTASGAVFEVESITVDADTANAQRRLKLDGGTLTMSDVSGQILVKSDLDTDDQRGKLWLTAGTTLQWECGGSIDLVGGASVARRVEIDLDDNLNTTTGDEVVTTVTGYVEIDIASGKVFRPGQLTLTGPNTRLSVTSPSSDSKLITSVPVGGCS